ncbi:DUF4192 domain-containing protein [Streptomyces sp. ISL-1]|uniref:DUF4192 domain-containing protein n=1 Tax=Streptomyces sp. ISL-1 TaxID=2817657 RepID=UPI001BEA9B5B|nr:DUF4192 domain-containing protein [Streptomyces sp. ISL-1]MBT2390718.1 DUF4192 domain-containing protein [Streptomyces sp. ISL-1]
MNIPENKLTINSLANLAEILPFMLGHYPDDSIVFHCPGPNFVDGPSMTCPLPEDPATWQQVAEGAACNFIHYAQDKGHGPDCNIVIYLCREPRPGQTAEETADLLRPVADRLVDALSEHRGVPQQTLSLVAGRWWAYACDLPGCCEGELLPALDDPTSITAQLIRLGYSPGRRTRDIIADFQPIDSASAPRLLQALKNEGDNYSHQHAHPGGEDASLAATRVLLEGAIRDFRNSATELADDIAARLIHGLQDNHARDHAFEFAEDDDLPHARRLWTYLARRCVHPYTDNAVPLLTTLAWVAWRQDDKITARLALRQALNTSPEYAMADLLHDAINTGADPLGLLDIVRAERAERLKRA